MAISRDAILAAALPLFAERGFDGVGLRAIGERVGLHNSSLFHHFRGKGDIAYGVLERSVEGVLAQLEPLARDETPRLESLERALGAASDHLAREPDAARVVLRALAGPPRPEWAPSGRRNASYPACVVRLFTLLWAWLERARDAGAIRDVRPRPITRALLGALLFDAASADGSPDVRRAELVAFVRAGLQLS